MEKILYTYSSLIKSIEGDLFKSTELAAISNQFNGTDGTASKALKKLSRSIGALDQRGSMMGFIMNIFILRDTGQPSAWNVGYGYTPRIFPPMVRCPCRV